MGSKQMGCGFEPPSEFFCGRKFLLSIENEPNEGKSFSRENRTIDRTKKHERLNAGTTITWLIDQSIRPECRAVLVSGIQVFLAYTQMTLPPATTCPPPSLTDITKNYKIFWFLIWIELKLRTHETSACQLKEFQNHRKCSSSTVTLSRVMPTLCEALFWIPLWWTIPQRTLLCWELDAKCTCDARIPAIERSLLSGSFMGREIGAAKPGSKHPPRSWGLAAIDFGQGYCWPLLNQVAFHVFLCLRGHKSRASASKPVSGQRKSKWKRKHTHAPFGATLAFLRY